MTETTLNEQKAAPAVSVVIPTYNHAEFLTGALQSVVNQSFVDWEAIIVNNFSTDNTEEIVKSFNDLRFRLVNFQNNGVIAASRNHGIQLAASSVIAFLDSDDIWYPNKLSRCLSEFSNGADLVCHGENWATEGLPSRAIYYGPTDRATHSKLLLRGNCVSTSATLVRKKLLDKANGFNENPLFITAEDYELWMNLSLNTSKFVFVHELLGEYRRHENGASTAVNRHLSAELAVIEHHARLEPTTKNLRIRVRHRRAKAFYSAGRTQMRAGNRSSAISFFLRALVQSPFFLRIYIAMVLTIIGRGA
jgi:glycosyltransferase involved in cell wall biosynthesis